MATIANVFIDGEILPENYIWPEEQATSLYRVRKQIEAAGSFDSIQLNIFSPGGYCLEGWAIYDYLLSLGKPINTLAYGQCASFGTVFHAMGKTREISPNCDYVIHRPWDFFMGNDLQNDEFAISLKKETDRLFSVYVPSTGLSLDELKALIREKDLTLSPQETVDKKFSTAIYQPSASARASFTNLKVRKPTYLLNLKDRRVNPNAPKDYTSNQNTMAEKKKSLIEAARAFLASFGEDASGPKALDVPLKDGRKIVTNSTGDSPVIGDTATIDGTAAPDGNYETEAGQTLTVTNGVITAVEDAGSDDNASQDPAASSADVVALKKENVDLKATVASQGQRLDDMERRMKAILGAMVSQDVPTQANRIPATGGKEKSPELVEREEMLAAHVAKFQPKTKVK